MVEEKKGQAKITIEIEVNAALMAVLKEAMPMMMKMRPGPPGK